MYLQPIFDSPDIAKQLPAEAKKFKQVDNAWRTVMNRVKKDPSCLTQCSAEGLLDKWTIADRDLEMVQKGLEVRRGETEVHVAAAGRTGVASGYAEEPDVDG